VKTGKIWGVTETLLKKPSLHIERLTILPDKRCSMHKHERKWNGFYVASGRLLIEVRKIAYDLLDVTELMPGEFMVVAPGEFHRFVTEKEGCTGIELYWPDDLSDDIVRLDVGGDTKPVQHHPV
jgi:mannose-6-phosphate isomerase-like protein (cupin superfamily)